MSKPRRKRQTIAARVPGVELLRLCHAAKRSSIMKRQNAAASIFSLLALQLQNEIVLIPEDMMVHYTELTR